MVHGTVSSLAIATLLSNTRWFAPYGGVVERDGVKQVFVGGSLIGQFDPADRDRGPRNVLLVTLAKEPTMHLGHLAAAFEIGEEYRRQLRRLEETQGLAAVLKPAMGGHWRITDAKRAELHALFTANWNITDATRRQRRGKGRVSRATVSREWHRLERRTRQRGDRRAGRDCDLDGRRATDTVRHVGRDVAARRGERRARLRR